MNDMTFPNPSHLDAWYSQKPTIAFMGEFSAGKSTLMNLVLKDDVLQTRVTATNMPVIWLTYADSPKAESLSRQGLLETFDIDDLGVQGQEDHLVIRLSLPCEILKRADIIDTPGISDARLDTGALAFLAPYLDAVIWCSAANQAWRQTEKVMWTSLPVALRANSVLALTRADTLRKENDLEKVIRRCTIDTQDLFAEVLPISSITALAALDGTGSVNDPQKWHASHAPALLDKISELIEIGYAKCHDRVVVDLPEQVAPPVVIEPAKEIAPNPEMAAEKPSSSEPKIKAQQPVMASSKENGLQVSAMKKELCQLAVTDLKNVQFFGHLNHILNAFRSNDDLSKGHKMVLDLTLPLASFDNVPREKLISQLIREFDDFANSTWHRLDTNN